VEGCFGSGKQKYSLDLIMARLPKGAETSISMAFVVMCAEKIRRLLRLFLSVFMPGFTPLKGQAGFGWRSGIVGGLRQEICCSLYSQACKLPTP
jgi:hypothetical protein